MKIAVSKPIEMGYYPILLAVGIGRLIVLILVYSKCLRDDICIEWRLVISMALSLVMDMLESTTI